MVTMARTRVHNANVTWVPHVQLSWGGTLGAGTSEVWTNGVKMACPGGAPTQAQLDGLLPTLQSIASNFVSGAVIGHNTGNSHSSTDVHVSWVKANYIEATGLQRDSQTHVLDFPPVSGLSQPVPFYQTYALTFRTALKRGRSHAGRIFPPCVSIPVVAGTGMASAADATEVATAGMELLNRINVEIGNAAGAPFGAVAVFSRGLANASIEPILQTITAVELDRVPDVQHRRTNRLHRSVVGPILIPDHAL